MPNHASATQPLLTVHVLSPACSTSSAYWAAFKFVGAWRGLGCAARARAYAANACRELAWFVFCKDPGLFRAVVAPLLGQKMGSEVSTW